MDFVMPKLPKPTREYDRADGFWHFREWDIAPSLTLQIAESAPGRMGPHYNVIDRRGKFRGRKEYTVMPETFYYYFVAASLVKHGRNEPRTIRSRSQAAGRRSGR